MQIDEFDRKILSILQDDASLSVAQLSERVGLSSTPCWRRLQKLEREGYIDGRVTLLNQSKIGLRYYLAFWTWFSVPGYLAFWMHVGFP